MRCLLVALALLTTWVPPATPASASELPTKSGLRVWVDPSTPLDRHPYLSSRGTRWELVMSDEFDVPGRTFEPGQDHLWTSLEKPDGVNAALEFYGHNMTTTVCDEDGQGDTTNTGTKTCYLAINVAEETTKVRVWNAYLTPPAMESVTFYYRSAMLQTWNKFCYQGGMLEARVQLPGATSSSVGNPDLAKPANSVASSIQYYPTWPGIWLMGNLGRALFTASTNRMWPFSYNECNPQVFNASNQRISACDRNPGYGLNPHQGRGAPEIDLLEGLGKAISSSVQIGPGMPASFRVFPAIGGEPSDCVYTSQCTTLGANRPDVPTPVFAARRHKSWYQALRYGPNFACTPDKPLPGQSYAAIKASLEKGITVNVCTPEICSASEDPHADLDLLQNQNGSSATATATALRWGINPNGSCYPVMNGYDGAFLCSPGHQDPRCDPKTRQADGSKVKPFAYQMDAISANWPLQVAAYTEFLTYQVEWVPGSQGYVRWMLSGDPIFEIPASSIENVPQDLAKSNPQKIMIEEPMYIILNVAVSKKWGASPPNPGGPCKGNGNNTAINKLCDAFPMTMKIDYIRLYQDTRAGSNMTVGCNPVTHPTREWIQGHLDEYQDDVNTAKEVSGRAFCRTDDDCTVAGKAFLAVSTGSCINRRCVCRGGSWSGPRCSIAVGKMGASLDQAALMNSYGPQRWVAISTAMMTLVLTIVSTGFAVYRTKQDTLAYENRFLRDPGQVARGNFNNSRQREPPRDTVAGLEVMSQRSTNSSGKGVHGALI